MRELGNTCETDEFEMLSARGSTVDLTSKKEIVRFLQAHASSRWLNRRGVDTSQGWRAVIETTSLSDLVRNSIVFILQSLAL